MFDALPPCTNVEGVGQPSSAGRAEHHERSSVVADVRAGGRRAASGTRKSASYENADAKTHTHVLDNRQIP